MDPYWLLLLILFLFAAIFSAVEIAFVTLSPVKVEAMIRQDIPGAQRIKKLKEKTDLVLISILIGVNVTNIGASALATLIATRHFGDSGTGIAVGMLSLLTLIFIEMLPKSLGSKFAENTTVLFTPFLQFIVVAFFPISYILLKINTFLQGDLAKHSRKVSEEEIHALADMGVEDGVIEDEEKEYIRNILQFAEKTVEDVMTPRVKTQMLDGEKTLADIFPQVQSGVHSRYPIYENTVDNIIGIFYLRDALRIDDKDFSKTKIASLAKPIIFFSYSTPLDDVLQEMKQKRVHMAIVHDEHGGTLGIVTLEDLIEELVGDIADETDHVEQYIFPLSENSWTIKGKGELRHIREATEIEFEDDHLTLGAYLLEAMEKMPDVGEAFETDEFRAEILAIKDHTIAEVRFTKKTNL